MLKIIHIITSLKVGGAEIMLKRLLEFDPMAISNTEVVSLTALGVIGESLRAQGVKVHALNLSPSIFNIPIGIGKLVTIIRGYQPEIIQTWMYHADLMGGLSAYLAGYKNIAWGIHHTSLSFGDSLKTRIVMKVCAVLSRWIPKKIICVANAARQTHIAAGYEASRMMVIPNGFDFSVLTSTERKRAAIRQTCYFSESDIVIGCVGRFHSVKGHDNLIKAAKTVTKQYSTVRFLLVGRDCDYNNAKLMHSIYDNGVQECFVLLGERNDVPDCLASMDIYCMPSRTEGFPLGLGEAMAMGLPCVATNVGDTTVLVGETAILVPPQNSQALAHGLLELIAMSEKQREKIGERAKERVMREFTIEKTHTLFKEVYKEMLLGNKT